MPESLPQAHPTGRGYLAGPVVLFGLCYIGYVKGAPILAQSPIDLTVLAGAMTVLAVGAHLLSRHAFDGRAVACVVGLWAVFSVGAVMTIGAEHGATKIALLNTLTLLCALGPCFVLASARAQRLWLHLSVAAGLAVAAAAVVLRDAAAWAQFGRLNLAGTTTIGTARVIGAAAVVATVMLALTRTRRWWWAAVAVSCTGAVVMVGSRGPAVALVLAVLTALLVGKVGRRRLAATLAGIVVIAATVWAVIESSTRHPERIARLLAGDLTDAAREALLREAVSAVLRNPLGVGWEGFGALPAIQASYGERSIYPHNFVVEVFLEGGWLAGVILLVLMGLSIRGYVRQSRSAESTAMLGLGVYWLAVAQTSADINGNRMTWAMLVLGLMYHFTTRDETRTGDEIRARVEIRVRDEIRVRGASGPSRR
jgi:O-antigen ligase